jgi:hypothetical protein
MTFLCSLLVACGSRGILLAACGSGDIEGDADLDEPGDDMGGDIASETDGDVGGEAGPDVSYDIPFEDTSWWECREDGDCTDDDPCTRNTCDPETHVCTSEPVNGLQLDEPAILLSEGPYFLGWPLMVWTGSEVGLTWRDGRDAGCADPWGTTFCAQETYFNKVTPDWTALPSDVRLSSSDALSSPTSIAWTGSEFVIAWNDRGRGLHEAYVTRVDAAGGEIGTEMQGTGWESAGYPALAWTGSEIAALWSGIDGTRDYPESMNLTRFDPSLAEIGSVLIPDVGSWTSTLAWTGSEFAAMWWESNAMLHRFSPLGDAVGTPTDLETRHPYDAWILWTGSEIAALWSGNLLADDPCEFMPGCTNVFLARIDPAGALAGEITAVSTTEYSTNLWGAAWTGSELGVGWYDETGRDYEGHLTRVAPDGALLEDVPIPRPSEVVWTGSEYVLAWNEEVDGGFGIFMSRTVLCE